jgi:hypothetical protein
MFVFTTNYRSTHFFARYVVTFQYKNNFVVESVSGLNECHHYINS